MPAVAAVNGNGAEDEEGEQRLRRDRREKMRQLQQDLDPRLDYEVRAYLSARKMNSISMNYFQQFSISH